ncbi:hypothetical protein [Castellaniella sp.]
MNPLFRFIRNLAAPGILAGRAGLERERADGRQSGRPLSEV